MGIINLFNNRFRFYRQLESADCGPTCLKMISQYYGKKVDILSIREWCYANKNGVSLADLVYASNILGFDAHAVKISTEDLINELGCPCILHWKENHYVVFLRKTKRNKILIADPSFGILKLNIADFLSFWKTDNNNKGVALLINPNEQFSTKEIKTEQTLNNKSYFLKYIQPFKYKFFLLLFLTLTVAGFSTVYPLINEKIVDIGINEKNIYFVIYLLIAQLVLYTSSGLLEFVQGWIFLKINTQLNINIISDFLRKLVVMPMSFFDNKISSDIILRIDDNQRVEDFFSHQLLHFIVSCCVFVIYSCLLMYYSPYIFSVFIGMSILSVLWVYLFQKQRKHIDYRRFELETKNKNTLYEMINGIADIKINNATEYKTSEWINIEQNKYVLNRQSMLLSLKQNIGVSYFSQIKNSIIMAYVAYLVMSDQLSLGAMLSISFIVGQLSVPIENFIDYLYSYQDASISLERLSEIYRKKNENEVFSENKSSGLTNNLQNDNKIRLQNVYYSYFGIHTAPLFENLNVEFHLNKINAIVGTSGSGKTTLVKLILKYYSLTKGIITYNGTNIDELSPDEWREKISVVFQDGYIFSDSLQNNITLGRKFEKERFENALKISNCIDFYTNLPQREKTNIGENGIGLSKGQKQRILIARAIYKDAPIILLDEATSALDAKNERIIHENLQKFFKDKTVIIVAHRLSTVKNADNIIVLDSGKIVEEGKHSSLIKKQGHYFNLVKNQLELQ